MKEVNTRQPEENPQKSSNNAAETTREKHQVKQEPQIHQPVMPPASQEGEKYAAAKSNEHIAVDLNQSWVETKTGQGQQKSTWTSRDDDLVNEILSKNNKSTQESTNTKASKRIEKLAAEKGWEAVADTLWCRMAEFETDYAKKYDSAEHEHRKLPDQADTREKIDERLSKIHAKPLTDDQWEEWKQIRQVDPATLTEDEWREWKRNPASMTQEAVRDIEAYLQEIAPAKEWLDRSQETERKKRWEQVAVPSFADRLGLDPSTLTPEEREKLASYDLETFNRTQWFGLDPLSLTSEQQKELADYNPLILQYAQNLGLNPIKLTPDEREDLAWGDVICERAKKLELDPRTLSAEERVDLRKRGRILTPEERKEREEWKNKYRFAVNFTDEELVQLLEKMHENNLAMKRKKAAWMHERDPRYDPMTGDLLEPDEHPLDPKAEYTFYGKTRARSFVHPEARSFLSPDSPLLKYRNPLQADGKEEEPEDESHERFVQRLLKAGFVEVEPTLADKASFEQRQWYRSLSPSEKMQFLQESMREMTRGRSIDKNPADEKFAKFIELLIDFMIAFIAPEIMEKKNRDQTV